MGDKVAKGLIKQCISSFKKLESEQIIEWNEENCSFDENEYVREAYKRKAWAFVSDFYRLKALYEYGGIYLDTDVEIKRPFDDMILSSDIVLGYMYDCALSTAVIMVTPKHPLIKALLETYNSAVFNPSAPNNSLLTDYLITNFSAFRLNGKFCEFSHRCFVYPKEYFEVPILFPFIGRNRGGYSVHYFSQFWKQPSRLKRIIRPYVKIIFSVAHFLTGYLINIRGKIIDNDPILFQILSGFR